MSASSAARIDALVHLDAEPWLAGSVEQDETRASRDRLLVARERCPCGLAVDLRGLGTEELLDEPRLVLEPGQPAGREETESDGLAVRERVVRGSLERVRERVAEIQLRPRAAIVRDRGGTPPP